LKRLKFFNAAEAFYQYSPGTNLLVFFEYSLNLSSFANRFALDRSEKGIPLTLVRSRVANAAGRKARGIFTNGRADAQYTPSPIQNRISPE
jgi:hypothetical protein